MGEFLRDYGNFIMDLQKVAAQATSVTNPRSEGTPEGKGILSIPFADMLRTPVMMVGDILGNRNETASAPETETEHPATVEKADNHRSDKEDERQVASRDNSRDESERADNREEKNSDDPSDDNAHRSADRDRDDSGDDAENADKGDDDVSQKASSDDSGNEESSTADKDDTADSSQATDSDNDSANASATDASVNVDVDAGFDTALDDLLAAAHVVNTADQKGETVKEAAQVLSAAAAGSKVAATNEVAKSASSTNAGQLNSSENANANGEQSRQTQQAQMTLARVGSQAPGSVTEAAKNTVDPSLLEQQAKALSDTIKSDKPVRVQVNVDNGAGTFVSQSSQSLNANAVAAQESANAQTVRTNTAQASAGNEGTQQAAQPRVDGNAAMTGQAQALNQLAQNNANSSADSGLNRATVQVSSSVSHATHGGGEGTNTTAAGNSINAQQTSASQKAEQAQAARTPQQARPLAQQISVNITKAISEGMDRISIQLRPDNLGRVEVKLEVTQNGRVSANIIVDRPETLEMLRNDSRNLERALQDAGLDTRGGDLSFNLRDHQENPGETESDSRMAHDDELAEDGDLEAEIATKLLNGEVGDIISDMRVDIRA